MNELAPLLIIDRISQSYAGREIVREFSLSLTRCEVLGLLGVNGAGKSTTLKMIAGMLAPTTGTVRFANQDLYEYPKLARRHIGYLPETPPLYNELNVYEYLRFCAQLRGLKKATVTPAIEYVVECCELGEVRYRLIGALSKGFRQRVGLAQAIIHKPDLVVLDEPASGLDPLQALKLRDLVRNLGVDHAVVLSTHVLSDVVACCNRVAILHDGSLHHIGPLHAPQQNTRLHIGIQSTVNDADWVAIPDVLSANAIDAQHWRVTLKPETSIPQLATTIVQQDWQLFEFRVENSTLEEIFLRIATQAPVV